MLLTLRFLCSRCSGEEGFADLGGMLPLLLLADGLPLLDGSRFLGQCQGVFRPLGILGGRCLGEEGLADLCCVLRLLIFAGAFQPGDPVRLIHVAQNMPQPLLDDSPE